MRSPPPQSAHLSDRFEAFWIVQSAVWLFAVAVGTFIGIATGLAPQFALFWGILRALTGFLITGFAIRPLLHWHRKRRSDFLRSFGFIFLLAALGSAVDWAVTNQLSFLFEVHPLAEQNFVLWLSFLVRWPLYTVWGILYWLYNERSRSKAAALQLAEMEAMMTRTELDLLRAQIDPHFIFNVLNGILAMAEKPEAVTGMTLALSRHLQRSLYHPPKNYTLEIEIDTVENYLRLEKYRFEENLVFTIKSDPAFALFPLPRGTLLLLAENAIKHGRKTSPNPLQIHISAQPFEDALLLTVENTGEWIPPESSESSGIGLANLRKTLEYFGGATALPEIASQDGRVRICIRLPIPNR